MRWLKLALISVIFFSVLLTIISFFFPSHVRISRATDIQTSKAAVMAEMNTKETGLSGWNVIEGSEPGKVTVQWFMDFHLRWYPWEKFSSLLLDKRYGSAMEKKLSELRTKLEK
jgi:hypothetical protein